MSEFKTVSGILVFFNFFFSKRYINKGFILSEFDFKMPADNIVTLDGYGIYLIN